MTYLMYSSDAVLEEQFQYILDHKDHDQERFVALQSILLAPFSESVAAAPQAAAAGA